jgi:hypothetical protein
MRCADRGREVFLAQPHESHGGVAAKWDDQKVRGLDCMNADEKHFGGITRAEVMEYLSQTYGAAFLADLAKRLP